MDYKKFTDVNLFPFQEECLEKYFVNKCKSFGLFMDMGLGKTLLSLLICLFNYDLGNIDSVLILPPANLIDNWIDEIEKHIKPKYHHLFNNIDKGSKLNAVCKYNIISQTMLSGNSDIPCNPRTMVILDESHNFKTPSAKKTVSFVGLHNRFYGTIMLSGTPLTNSGLDMYIPSKILGYGLNRMEYVEKHCYENIIRVNGRHVITYTPEVKNRKELLESLDYCTFWKKSEEVILNLPEQNFIKKYFRISDEQKVLLDSVNSKIISEHKKNTYKDILNIMKDHIQFINMVSSGLMVNNKTGDILEIGEGKKNLLKQIIKSIPENEQIIILCTFHAEMDYIKEILTEMKVSFAERTGKNSKAEKNKAVKDFKSDEVRVLLGITSVNSEGLTLVNCKHMIYWSLDFSMKVFSQSKKRIHRIGQEEDVNYYFLLSSDPDDEYFGLDSLILKSLDKKEYSLDKLFNK